MRPLGMVSLLVLLAWSPTPAAADQDAPQAGAVPSPAATRPPAAPGGEEAQPRAVLGRIRGTVYDASRAPRAGLMVQLSSRGHQGLLRVTGTDERGQYLFQDLPAGRYDIEVGGEGYARQRKEGIEVRPPFQNIIDFRFGASLAGGPAGSVGPEPTAGALPGATAGGSGSDAGTPAPPAPPVTVRGTFLDQQRRPVGEVSVTFVALQNYGAYQTFSDPDGTFLIEGVPPGRYRVLVDSPGHISLTLPGVEVLPGAGLDLSLTLVDYPLNFKGRRENLLPREEPRPAPTPPAAPPPSPSATPPSPPGSRVAS